MENIRLAAYLYLTLEPLTLRGLDPDPVLNTCLRIQNSSINLAEYYSKNKNLKDVKGIEEFCGVLESILLKGPIITRLKLRDLARQKTRTELLLAGSSWYIDSQGNWQMKVNPSYKLQGIKHSPHRYVPNLDDYDIRSSLHF